MKSFLSIFLWTVCVVFPSAVMAEHVSKQADIYLSVMPDIPLMVGLREEMTQSVIFDKEDGRVAETVLLGDKTTPESIKLYYDEALGQLGWKARKSGVFVRNDEQLIVIIEKVGGGGKVVLSLSPKMP